jgi:hypothetical protein
MIWRSQALSPLKHLSQKRSSKIFSTNIDSSQGGGLNAHCRIAGNAANFPLCGVGRQGRGSHDGDNLESGECLRSLAATRFLSSAPVHHFVESSRERKARKPL